jgi:uncharacterized protein YqgC (DUF456 family)
MNDWVLYILLLVTMAGCLWLALLQLPGIWIMLIATAIYAYLTGGRYIGPWTLTTLAVVALVAETVETLAAAAGARRAGASKTAMLFSIIGAIVGGFTLTFIPIPVVGTLVGVCLGAFLGATLAEVAKGRSRVQSFRSGWGAAAGRLVGTIIKASGGAAMLLIAAIAGLPL